MGISREMVFALLTFLIIPVIVLLRATLHFGSLEVEKTSSCSKPYTALMRVIKKSQYNHFLRRTKMFPKESKMESG